MVQLTHFFSVFMFNILLKFLYTSSDMAKASLIARQDIPEYCLQTRYSSFSLYAAPLNNSTNLTPIKLVSYSGSDEFTLSVCIFNAL
jgi:hypothetical protein